jgi:GT2 family glycosyltransferase/glycosyltransferase involved in cell wall biosynthesis
VERDYEAIWQSGLFDGDYYVQHNADVGTLRDDPLKHYLDLGWREGRNPNRLFNTQWYLETYPDVAETGLNPLVHYLRFGGFMGRNPSPNFDSEAYLESYPDVCEAGVNPLSHYLTCGALENREARRTKSQGDRAIGPLSPYEAWIHVNRLSARDVSELRSKLNARSDKLPKISVVTPVYDTNKRLLEELVESVRNQIYDNWELCLVNDASPSAHVAPLIERFAQSDERIRVRHLAQNGGISLATNSAVAMATGEIVAFLDHDDLLAPDCLAELAVYYADHPDADIVYSDDDKIDLKGRRYAPQFKPDWSPILLLSWMYISHVFSVRKSLFTSIGGFRSDFDGSQDYDFALRAAEVARHVGHIPKILYHWRAVEGSTASGGEAKPESMGRGLKAANEALKRRGLSNAKAHHPDWAQAANVGMFDLIFAHDGPSVTVVIPTRDKVGLLRNCLHSLEKTKYKNYEILVVDNDSEEDDTLEYLQSIDGTGNSRVVRIPSPPSGFNYANLNNEAVKHCSSEYVLFLNNDTEVITPNWLSQMVGYAQMDGVGAVGARLYFEDGTLQHAGIVHGYHEGLVGHAFRGLPAHDWGYLGFVRSSREYSGVTAACMLTPRKLFLHIGGFDEENFAVAYNDVDYCYRVVQHGKTCVYCASAELWHYEGKTRGFNDDPQERSNFRRLYGDRVDPWYNPNLSLENERFQPEAVRPETASKDPVRLVAVSHNLNNEGAPTTLLDLLVGLARAGFADPVVLSPSDGPLRKEYQRHGIEVIVLDKVMHGVKDADTQLVGFAGLGMLFRALGAEVVLGNTLQTYWAIKGATLANLPSIWAQHESEPWETYFDDLPPDMRPSAYGAFAEAYRVLYVADATRRAWRPVETRHNFKVIRHGIPPERLQEETARWSRDNARNKLEITDHARVVSVVGTVCGRKGQVDIAEAYLKLPAKLRESTYVYIAGKIVDLEYVQEFPEELREGGSNLILTDHIEDPFLYYAASDVAVCTSRIESAPRVLVEAMASGLPIITTPVFGIPELVRENVNAVYYEVGDTDALAASIEKLLTDVDLRQELAANSPKVLAGQPGFKEMVEQYGRVVRQAVNLATTPERSPGPVPETPL